MPKIILYFLILKGFFVYNELICYINVYDFFKSESYFKMELGFNILGILGRIDIRVYSFIEFTIPIYEICLLFAEKYRK